MRKIKAFIKPIYKAIFPDLISYVPKELKDCDSILDLGCGRDSVVQYCSAAYKVGVDLFEPYLEESKRKGFHNEYIKEDVTKVNFPPKSFDAIVMIDVLEHLTKEQGLALLAKIDQWAKKKVIIFTPNGFVHQNEYDHNLHQEHKSGWSSDDLKRQGFVVYGGSGYKALRGDMALLKYKPSMFWFVISELSQKLVYYFPKLAYHLYAVKTYGSKK